jgi:hypothetical protein
LSVAWVCRGSAEAAQQQGQLEEEGLPRLVGIAWKLAAYDIQDTAARSCNKALSDKSVSRAVRKKRAEGGKGGGGEC